MHDILYRQRVKMFSPFFFFHLGTDVALAKAFDEALQGGKSQLKRARIMAVGDARVGKTSLFRRLTGQGLDNTLN